MSFQRSAVRRAWAGCAVVFALSSAIQAQPWMSMDSHTRYAALGDSISAGYGALPATHGFPYQLYQGGVIDNVNNTLFAMMAVPGAMTSDVLDHQLPQLSRFLHPTGIPYRQVITLQIGANDLFQVMAGANPDTVLNTIGTNLYAILTRMTTDFPNARIYVGNYYDPQLPVSGEKVLIILMNQAIANVVGAFSAQSVVLVDVYSAFEGRNGLLLIEKKGANQYEAHPTNAGQNVIADVFAHAIRGR